MKTKDPKKVKRGKKSKAQGAAFEKKTREDLIEKGWIVDRWSNNVEFGKELNHIKIENGKLIPAKVTWRRTPKGMFPMGLNSGFPDFVCFRKNSNCPTHKDKLYRIIGVESKMSGTLDKEEKLKCRWLLDNRIFSKILVSKKLKIKNKIVVEYEDFIEIERRMK